jgi:hypothetical protein
MRHLAIALLTLLFSGLSAQTQMVPDAPAPAPDPAWTGLQSLANGQAIVVTDIENRSVHCLFAGATEEYLFCCPAGNPPGVGFRFDRAQVLSVDLDRPNAPRAHVRSRERNYHPGWISSMIPGGIIVGLVASQNTSAGHAAEDGLIGAGVVGLIGAPVAFLPHPQLTPPGRPYPPYFFGARFGFPISRIRK